MGINEQAKGRESTSPYRRLYMAIDALTQYGVSSQDEQALALGQQLHEDLANFESNFSHHERDVKHTFKDHFLKVLHSKDNDFSTSSNHTVKCLINAVHIRLYSTVFLNHEHLSAFSLFQNDRFEQHVARLFPTMK